MQSGATDEPAARLSGQSCVGRAAPLLNVRQGWMVSREKGQRGFGAGKRRQQGATGECEINRDSHIPWYE